ncbi:MAG: AEC family transporter [Lachnospiraceae bacterium]|nr:AEC family transporter [Lachnospiraceae bacterium]
MTNLVFPLVSKILSLLVLVGAGVVLVKTKLLKKEDSVALSKISVFLLSPCVIVSSFSMKVDGKAGQSLLLCFFYAILANFLFLFLGTLLRKPLHLSPVEEMSLEYTNCGNFVLPIVASVLGEEYLLYVSAYITVYNLLVWTHGIHLFQGKAEQTKEEKSKENAFLKILFNPNILAILFGVFLFFTKISLPAPISLAISDLGKMIGPISMLITGIILGSMSFKKILSYRRIYMVTAFRLLFFPFIYLLLISVLSRIEGFLDNPVLFLVTFLSAMAPAAANVSQFAILYGKEEEYASCINIFTTLCTIISVPILVYLSGMILR